MALLKETEEDSQEKKWREMYYKDPAALWKSIDWKESAKEADVIPPHTIYSFFTDVFQSKKTADNPTLDEYALNDFCNEDDGKVDGNTVDITMEELDDAIKR